MEVDMDNTTAQHNWRNHSVILQLVLAFLICYSSTTLSQTEIIFNQPVDHRYAWVGNEARGSVDFKAELISMIQAANASIDVSSMSFGGVEEIADELALAATNGINVRIHGNSGHRHGEGYMRSLRGPVQLADNNLSALLYRINFQQSGSTTPAGFLADTGQVFGPRGGGVSYGWSADMTGDMKTATVTTPGLMNFTSSLLGDCYARPNSAGVATWEIAVPNGYYYVYPMVGQATYASQTHLNVEGQPVFFNSGPGFDSIAHTGIGEFEGANVEGGSTDGNVNSQRIQVTDGKLTVTIGNLSAPAWSSLDFIEIYQGSPDPFGDNGSDKSFVQDRQLQHAKYLIFDAATPNQKLWASSGNLTAAMLSLSEDALITDEVSVINAFSEDFNHRWGGTGLMPIPASATSGRFKPGTSLPLVVSVPNSYLGLNFDWHTRFSPTNSAYNIYGELASYIDSAQHDLIFNMEQLTDSADVGPLMGTNRLMNEHLDPFVASGKPLYGVFGNSEPTDSILTRYTTDANAHVANAESIHTKAVLADALRDTRFRRQGRVLMGSMNWSQGGMHFNDEHTLILDDPALANQYLQRAMAVLNSEGIMPSEEVDMVLVLDRSYSMNDPTGSGTTKIEATRSAAKLFVDILDTSGNHRASMVRFGQVVEPFSPAITMSPLTPSYANTLRLGIDDTQADLPIGNATAYGLALQAAMAEFGSVGDPKPRRLIHFFTDGKENQPPWANEVDDDLIAAGIEIHSTAFGSFDIYGGGPTAVLADMASASGGTFAQVPDDAVSLKKRFAEIARDAMAMSTILDPTFPLVAGGEFTTEFMVDDGLSELKVLGLWDRPRLNLVELGIVTPDGTAITSSMPWVRRADEKGHQVWHINLAKLARAGHPVAGMWKVTGRAGKGFADLKRENVDIMVLGKGGVRFDAEVYPSAKGGEKLQLVARILRGKRLILNAEIRVMWQAQQVEDKYEPVTVSLYDDGKHGDGRPNDGVYGNQIVNKQKGNQRYHFAVRSTGKGKKPIEGKRYPGFQREAVVYYTTAGGKEVEVDKPGDGIFDRFLRWWKSLFN
jgi:hypothetical protein